MLLGLTSADPGAMGYAFGLGLVGAANPCGLPLLPAYVSLFADGAPSSQARLVRALGSSACVTAGFVTCFGLLGLALGAVVAGVESVVPWLMVGFGAVLAVLGALGLAGWRMKLSLPQVRVGRGGPAGMFGFGIVYALASLGCALPVFLVAVGGGLDHSGLWVVLRSALAYALGMGAFLAVLALAAVTARRALVKLARPVGRAGHWLAGVLLTISGCYLAYYWATSLADPHHTPALVTAVNSAQASLSSWMATNSDWLGICFGVLVIGVLAAASYKGDSAQGTVRSGTRDSSSADTGARSGRIAVESGYPRNAGG